MELTEKDVLEIVKLFEQSRFDFLQLEHGDRKITVSKGGFMSARPEAAPAGPPGAVPRAPAVTASAPVAPAAPPTAATTPEPGLVAVTAPMVGKFYAAPSPSEPSYTEIGSRVAAGATVGLIEVMKVFTSIKTETAGVVERILVKSGDFVEFGQTLFWLRPDQSA
jgi:acetyl-CoA carboxylase biotin carboxyl carrier protein